jgi:hypothetical protein
MIIYLLESHFRGQVNNNKRLVECVMQLMNQFCFVSGQTCFFWMYLLDILIIKSINDSNLKVADCSRTKKRDTKIKYIWKK